MKRRWRVVGTSLSPAGLVSVREMDRFRTRFGARLARRRYEDAPLLAMSRALGLRFEYHLERLGPGTKPYLTVIEGRRVEMTVWDDPTGPPVSKPGDAS